MGHVALWEAASAPAIDPGPHPREDKPRGSGIIGENESGEAAFPLWDAVSEKVKTTVRHPARTGAYATSVKSNLALVRRLYAEIDKGNEAILDKVFAKDFVEHDSSTGAASTSGLAGVKLGFERSAAAFEDSEHVIEDIFAAGDRVVVRIAGRGRHTGVYQGAAPTGKYVTENGIVIYRIARGKVVEEWSQSDHLGFLRQLGIVPPPRP